MTNSDRWGGFSDEAPRPPPGNGKDPVGRWALFAALILFALLLLSLVGLIPW